jgi:methylmalonyl-CoA mutase C-terminal domain/subunit
MTLVPRIIEGLRERDADDVLVVVGGTIPADDAEELLAGGVPRSSPRSPTGRSSTSSRSAVAVP